MDTINNLPAHILFVHFVVVLIPVTAVFLIACAVWRSLRNLLWWAAVVLSAGLIALTQLTQDAGEWLQKQVPRSPAVNTHTELGDTGLYIAIALFIASLLIAAVHWRERRTGRPKNGLVALVAVLTIAIGVGSCAQIYRIGDSGAKAVWGDTVQAR